MSPFSVTGDVGVLATVMVSVLVAANQLAFPACDEVISQVPSAIATTRPAAETVQIAGVVVA